MYHNSQKSYKIDHFYNEIDLNKFIALLYHVTVQIFIHKSLKNAKDDQNYSPLTSTRNFWPLGRTRPILLASQVVTVFYIRPVTTGKFGLLGPQKQLQVFWLILNL